MNCVAVIPCLNEARHIGAVVRGVFGFLPRAIVVDDGSADATSREAASAGAEVIRHETNEGKGAAVQTGLRHAYEAGLEWALLMDGDGQHAASDIPKLLREVEGSPEHDVRSEVRARQAPHPALVIGNRMTEAHGMPWLRRLVNRWMSARLSRRLGMPLPDTQCGFRLVHLASWARLSFETSHFEVESEMVAAFAEAGFMVRFVPIQVIYKSEQSKIAPLRDSLRWFRWWYGRSGSKRRRAAAVKNVPAKRLELPPSAAAIESSHAP